MTKKHYSNLEMEISALNHLVYVNGVDFIDPRNTTNTLESTIKSIVEVYRVALSSDSFDVHKAVAQGLIHIIESCIKPKYDINLTKIEELLINPLEHI